MTMLSHASVRACVERAMVLDRRDVSEGQRLEAAIAATAQALDVPVEDVRECVQREEQPA
jgi:hypothetical protein